MPHEQPNTPVFHFDFVDPISYLLDREIEAVEAELGVVVTRVGVEINPRPHPVGTPEDELWASRWTEAERIADRREVPFRRPRLIPWSRKAHELLAHASAIDPQLDAELRKAVMAAFFRDGLDIGRVDVLVALARTSGLDETETKAVLDVDRYDEDVARRRADAVEAGLRVVPTLTLGSERLEGFHNRASLSTFLSDLLSSY